jgi:tetratricopeptide (TPR) repeat protein
MHRWNFRRSTINPRTTEEDIAKTVEALDAHAQKESCLGEFRRDRQLGLGFIFWGAHHHQICRSGTRERKANLELAHRWPTIPICPRWSVFFMEKFRSQSKNSRKQYAEELFIRASKQEENGDLRSAFRLYLAAAKAGEISCQVNVGNFYDAGTGVRRNRSAAIYWYKRAYRRGDSCAASNIGVMWRNDKKPKRALEWFRKAVRLGDDEANLEIAKYYLRNEQDSNKAIQHLKKVCQSNCVTEAGKEEATRLLKLAKKRSTRS